MKLSHFSATLPISSPKGAGYGGSGAGANDDRTSSSSHNGLHSPTTSSTWDDTSRRSRYKSGLFSRIHTPLVMRQFSTLIWKNNLIRRRHWVLTLLEVALPLLISALALISNTADKRAQLEYPVKPKTIKNLHPDLDPSRRYLVYAPKNEFTDRLMSYIDDPPVTLIGVRTAEEMDAIIRKEIPTKISGIDVVFDSEDRNITIGGVFFEGDFGRDGDVRGGIPSPGRRESLEKEEPAVSDFVYDDDYGGGGGDVNSGDLSGGGTGPESGRGTSSGPSDKLSETTTTNPSSGDLDGDTRTTLDVSRFETSTPIPLPPVSSTRSSQPPSTSTAGPTTADESSVEYGDDDYGDSAASRRRKRQASDSKKRLHFPADLKMVIRARDVRLPKYAFPKKQDLGLFPHSLHYVEKRFMSIQIMVSHAYLRMVATEFGLSPEVQEELIPDMYKMRATRFPYPRWVRHPRFQRTFLDQFFPGTDKAKLVQLNLEYCVVTGFLIMILLVIKRIVDEKVNKAKELLRLMRLRDIVYYGSHFMNTFMIMIIQCGCLVVLFTCLAASLLEYASPTLIFAILLLYCYSSLLMAMLLSCFFTLPVRAMIFSCILWLGLSEVFGFLFSKQFGLTESSGFIQVPEWAHLALCLFPNYALKILNDLLIECDVYGKVAEFQPVNYNYIATWGNINQVLPLHETITIGKIMTAMGLSGLLSAIMIWYVDAVWPWQDSPPKPFYFPFLPSYWGFTSGGLYDSADSVTTHVSDPYNPAADQIFGAKTSSKYFEEPPSKLRCGLSVHGLRKVFKFDNRQKVAVKSVNLDLYYSQISVLLGHNGAGKTTLISMLTGLHKPSAGRITIDGYDALSEPDRARNSVGLCPQHDVLYDGLTVAEHLIMFGIIKGYPLDAIEEEVDSVIKLLRLVDKKETLSKNLSGGMKRRLSLGIALVGGSKILILDEPSSGLDPEARRGIWDFLLSVRKDRLILLTTHHMEEADALGDRIAIMAAGEVKCAGSTVFLKQAFGAGYHLRIAKRTVMTTTQSETEEDPLPLWNKDLFNEFIATNLPGAVLELETANDIMYAVDRDYCPLFPTFFRRFDAEKELMGVTSCGVSVSSMDDVFLKVGLQFEEPHSAKVKPSKKMTANSIAFNRNYLANGALPDGSRAREWQRFKALFMKRYHDSKRNYKTIVVVMALAVGSFGGMLGLLHSTFSSKQGTEIWRRDLTLESFGYQTPSIGFANVSSYIGEERGNEVWSFVKEHYIPAANAAGVQIIDMTSNGTDLGEWLLNLSNADLYSYRETHLVGFEYKNKYWTPWWQGEASHTLPVSFAIFFNALLSRLSSRIPELKDRSAGPLTMSASEMTFKHFDPTEGLLAFMGRLFGSVFIPFSVAFISAFFATFPTQERVTKSKLLQMMTGVTPGLFWAAHFAFDYLVYCAYCLSLIVMYFVWEHGFYFFGVYFVTPETSLAFVWLVFMFGFSGIPFSYGFSFWNKKASTSFGFVCITALLLGLVASLVITFYETVLEDDATDGEKVIFQVILWVLRLVPHVNLVLGLLKLYALDAMRTICTQVPDSILELACPLLPKIDTKDLRLLKPMRCCRDDCKDECAYQHPFFWNNWLGINDELFMLAVNTLMYWGIIFFIEYRARLPTDDSTLQDQSGSGMHMSNGSMYKPPPSPTKSSATTLGCLPNLSSAARRRRKSVVAKPIEDRDVLEERRRTQQIVERREYGKRALTVVNMTKRYPNGLVAVDHLNFSVGREEMFGFLGINGAGKTTTFKMMVGDHGITEGNSYAEAYDIRHHAGAYRRRIGYCPQFDALLDRLNSYETLELFARLRGVPDQLVPGAVQDMVAKVDLIPHAHGKCVSYSGGNRRKLSVGVALIGEPPVIFLDEPTAGVDPAARRKMWQTLRDLQAEFKCSIILTSHSMDECEALCDRVAIMVSGQFRCLGSTQSLREKFCQGYTLVVKFKSVHTLGENGDTYVQRVRETIESAFPAAALKDVHERLLYYHIPPSESLDWSRVFAVMEDAKRDLDLDDYQLSDTNLEQIFLSFAKVAQSRETDRRRSSALMSADAALALKQQDSPTH